MGTWEGLPVGPKVRKFQPNEPSASSRARGCVMLLVLVLAAGFLVNLSRGGPGAEPSPTPVPTARPAVASAPTSTPTPPPRPTATRMPTPSPTAEPRTLVVANTGGAGVYLRRTPGMRDRIKAWPDRTPMVAIGEEQEGEGRRWLNVRDPDGNEGWVPIEYLTPASTTPPTPGRAR